MRSFVLSIAVICAAVACGGDEKANDGSDDGGGDSDPAPLSVVSSVPAADAVDVAVDVPSLTVTFSAPLATASLPAQLDFRRGDAVTATAYAVDGASLVVTFGAPVGNATRCTLRLPASLRSTAGAQLATDVVIGFTTAAPVVAALPEVFTGDDLTLSVGNQVGIDDAGNIIVMYANQSDFASTRRLAADATVWSVQTVANTGTSAALAIAANGDAFVITNRFVSSVSRNFAGRFIHQGTWQAPAQISSFGDGDGTADLAMDDDGRAVAVFRASYNAGTPQLRLARFNGSAWQAGQFVDDMHPIVGVPHVVTNGAGSVWVLWSATDGAGAIKTWAAYAPLNGAFSVPKQIDGNLGVARAVDLSVNGSGVAVALWSEGDDDARRYWVNSATGGTWATATRLDDLSGAKSGRVTVCDSGSAFVVWSQTDAASGHDDIWASRFAAGVFGAPEHVEQSDLAASGPRVVCDSVGNATVAFIQDSDAVASLWTNRYVAGTGWRGAALVEQHAAIVEKVDLAVNASGRVVAAWTERDAGGTTRHVWAQPLQ